MGDLKFQERVENLRLAEKGAKISIIAYICLSGFKLTVGYISGSKALFADGLNNATDIVASVAVLIGLKISKKPADDNHTYGHFRAETIASLVASLIMIAVGLDVFYNAIKSMIFFEAKAPNLISAATALICSFVIYMVYRYNKHIALKINSAGLMAAAKDNLSDAWVSIGAAVGIIASQFGMPWIDPLAAVIVGCLIIKTGWDIFLDASHNLSDGFDKTELDMITDRIRQMEGVLDVNSVKARSHGNVTHMDLVVFVDPHMTVIEGHAVSIAVESILNTEFEITEVMVHIEPFFNRQ